MNDDIEVLDFETNMPEAVKQEIKQEPVKEEPKEEKYSI